MAHAFAEFFFELTEEYKSDGKQMHIALSGGSTPHLFFDILAAAYTSRINWKNLHIYWGDERMVPESDPDSNYGDARRLLFDKIAIAPVQVHPIIGSNNPELEAKRYSEVLNQLPVKINDIPSFDLIILGMGEDGHTASLFPNQMHLIDSVALCEIAKHPVSAQKRISLTGTVINHARHVAFLITGENKAEVVASIVKKEADSKKYPAAHIAPIAGKMVYYLDQKAATLLT